MLDDTIPQNKNENQKRFQSILGLDVVNDVKLCLCSSFAAPNKKMSPPAKGNKMNTKFTFGSNKVNK